MSLFTRCLLLATAAASSVAIAQSPQTWVSGVGDDLNPCTRTAPCLTFAGALAQTEPGGEINVLDRGEFGPVTINKAVTLNGNGHQGTIETVMGANGITVTADANDVVRIRGLALNGVDGQHGIDFVSGALLVVDDCRIAQFPGDGIHYASTGNAGMLQVQDTTLTANGAGITVSSAGPALAKALVLRTSITGNSLGFVGGPLSQSTLVQVQASQHALEGVLASSSNAGNAEINLERVSVSQNGTGIHAAGTAGVATVRVSKSRVFQNTVDVFKEGGGVLSSGGDNQLATTEPLPSSRYVTTITVTAPASVKVGAPASITATASTSAGTPTGRITFREGATVLGELELVSGAATIEVPNLSFGRHSFSAQYAGSEAFSAAAGSVTVIAANEEIVESSSNPRSGCVAAGSTANVVLLLLAMNIVRRRAARRRQD